MKKGGKSGCVMAIVLAAFLVMHPMSKPDDKHLSPEAARIVLNVEGCEKDPYLCSAGKVTVGVGHTGSDVDMEDETRSELEIAALMHKDVTFFEDCVKKLIPSENMTQGQFDSYVLFAMNGGCGNFKKSQMYREGAKGNLKASCEGFPLWANIRLNGKLVSCQKNRKVCGGVADRRQLEKSICLSSTWPKKL